MGSAFALAPDAEIVLGIASTAMPFARTPGDAAERWLRVLRSHGEVGATLQTLGVSEGTLHAFGEEDREPSDDDVEDHDAVARIAEHALRIAAERGATQVGTTDVLMAVMCVYGADFDRVLQAHGTSRDEVIERLGASAPRLILES